MRQRINGGIIGIRNPVSISSASGLNTLVDVQQNQGAGLWPKPGYIVEYLVVAGGGGGDGGYGGGGGAGGFRTGTDLFVSLGTSYTTTVGAGGAVASKGADSVFSTITSTGGGFGGSSYNNTSGGDGGSGGGGRPNAGLGNVPATVPSQGNNGAVGASQTSGSGGGGAGAPGSGKNGGAGLQSSISGISPAPYYAGGGGGYQGGSGGIGGGGSPGVAGTANTGGGGGADDGTGARTGGSGIVILRYLGAQRGTGGTITTSGGYTIHTFTTSGTFIA